MKQHTSQPYTTERDALERECVVTFVRGSGPGGQHRNKRYTGVRLKHKPSGLVQSATERRSQARNRELAFQRLLGRLKALNAQRNVPSRKPNAIPRGVQEARLVAKKRRSQRKAERRFTPELF